MARYETVFSGMALDLWRALVTPEETEAEVGGVLRWVAAPPGAALLDVPCGNGRHARRLAARGYRVTGVDISEEFLAEARAASAAEAPAAVRVRADMAAESLLPLFDPRLSLSVGDTRVEIVNRYEPAEGRLDTTYAFERQGRRETRRASHRVFTAAEIRLLLADAGLERVGLYADLDGAPFTVGASRLFVVAQRTGGGLRPRRSQ